MEIALPKPLRLPTQDDLPCEDGVPMETERHRHQMNLLIETLHLWLGERGHCSGNMFIYFSADQLRGRDFRGPDFFVVLDVPIRERKSWVVWEENRSPDLVIELLSDSTAEFDKTGKKHIYETQMRVPEYYWYDPHNPDDLAGFALMDGRYQPLPLDAQGNLPSPLLGLVLTRWQGEFMGYGGVWLRWATPDGQILPTDGEAGRQQAHEATRKAHEATRKAHEATQQASQAMRERDLERQRAEALEAELARLRASLNKPSD